MKGENKKSVYQLTTYCNACITTLIVLTRLNPHPTCIWSPTACRTSKVIHSQMVSDRVVGGGMAMKHELSVFV